MSRKGRPKNPENELGYIKPQYIKPRKGVIEKQLKNIHQERINEALCKIYYIANNTDRLGRGDKQIISKIANDLVELI